ncbi:hypothetical protein E5K00_21420 [Hymenobacter aquaticus]|uniref:Uncharacterized protein n=1 Tax=Hymenobacter aquaticus TaxID=1867101 RepID=A0A4Z0PS56_9BACT|nr:hypothetical protein [Hymenobacter aquaticus]TGE20557.1 hypothetical protein E5K00_21420 [Hymenobacter aquaticus]
MGKQVEVAGSPHLPDSLTLAVGDTARFWASGALVVAGAGIVAVVGPYLRTTAHDTGARPRPAGLPNTVQVEARQPGQATVKLFLAAGILSPAPRTHLVQITVNVPE